MACPDSKCCPTCEPAVPAIAGAHPPNSSSSTVSPPTVHTGVRMHGLFLSMPSREPLLLSASCVDANPSPLDLVLTPHAHMQLDGSCYALVTARLRSVTYIPARLTTQSVQIPLPGHDSSQSPPYKFVGRHFAGNLRPSVLDSRMDQPALFGKSSKSVLAAQPASIVLEFPFAALLVWMRDDKSSDSNTEHHGSIGTVRVENENKVCFSLDDRESLTEAAKLPHRGSLVAGNAPVAAPSQPRGDNLQQLAPGHISAFDGAVKLSNQSGEGTYRPEALAADVRKIVQLQELCRSLQSLVGFAGSESLGHNPEVSLPSCVEQSVSERRSKLFGHVPQDGLKNIAPEGVLNSFAFKLASWDLPQLFPYMEATAQRSLNAIADEFVSELSAAEHIMGQELLSGFDSRNTSFANPPNNSSGCWSAVESELRVISDSRKSLSIAVADYEPRFSVTKYCTSGRKCDQDDFASYDKLCARSLSR